MIGRTAHMAHCGRWPLPDEFDVLPDRASLIPARAAPASLKQMQRIADEVAEFYAYLQKRTISKAHAGELQDGRAPEPTDRIE
jgi:hypothetical protein